MIYASCFNYIPVTFSWTGADRTQPEPGSPGSVLLLPAGPGIVPGRAATPTPRNTVLKTARGEASKDVTRSQTFFFFFFCLCPRSRVVLDSAAVFSSVRRKRRSFTRFSSTVEGRHPERHFPKGFGGSPHPSLGTSKGRRTRPPPSPDSTRLSAGDPTQTSFCPHRSRSIPGPTPRGYSRQKREWGRVLERIERGCSSPSDLKAGTHD